MVEIGYCQCGCGERTTVSKENDASKGWSKGKPLKFIRGHANKGKTIRNSVANNLHKAIEIDESSGCWNWEKCLSQGYGVFRWNGRSWLAHRAIYMMAGNKIPDGMDLDHLCGNRRCVNPEHLRASTRLEHMRRRSCTS